MRGLWRRKLGRVAKRILPAAVIGLGLGGALLPNAAQAQFFGGWGGGWDGGWGGGGGWGGMGAGQVYRSISERGYRLIAPLRRNGAVFVADVVDRRGRRERLIVAAADAEILQRFLLAAPSQMPRNAVAQPRPDFEQPTERADRGDLFPPASIPNVGDPSYGNRDETAVEPVRPRSVPKVVRPLRPRVVDRTPDQSATSPRDAAPDHNLPRPKLRDPLRIPSEPSTTTASRPIDTPEKPSVSAPSPATPPTTTTKMSDPLAIPGGEPKPERHPEEAPKASAAASAPRVVPGTVTGAPAAPASPPLTPAPKVPAKSGDVPVAPLD